MDRGQCIDEGVGKRGALPRFGGVTLRKVVSQDNTGNLLHYIERNAQYVRVAMFEDDARDGHSGRAKCPLDPGLTSHVMRTRQKVPLAGVFGG